MKPSIWIRVAVMAALAMLWLSPATLRAQDDYGDPPDRVARMNYVEGSVSFQPGGEGDWLTAVPNRPLTEGDNVWTDQGSRAELHVGSTALRLGPETSMTFLNLDDRDLQLRLAEGSMMVRVRHLDDGDNFEVDTPNLAFNIVRTGEYRIDVNSQGDATVVSVWQGQGYVTGGGDSFTVVAGQQARFTGINDLRHDIDPIPAYDPFENWVLERERREEHFATPNYISEEMTGYEDLDDYGQWTYVGEYGNVWVPRGVPIGWAPYRYGHWAWIAPWGWTWVEDEPWGFAPFHYGRWANGPGGWFWVPGPVVVRPIYAPALVAFVGGVGFELGGGPAVAWFPLAPGEVYVPGYRVSRTYVERINVTNTRINVTQVTNVYNTYINNNVTRINYRYQRQAGAVTAVQRDTFVNARPVARNLVRVDERQVTEAPIAHQPPAEPTRASREGAGGPTRVRPPAAVERRQVIASRAPAPPRTQQGEPSTGRPTPRTQETPPADRQPRNVPRPPDTNREAPAGRIPADRTLEPDRVPAPQAPAGRIPTDRTREPDRVPAPQPPEGNRNQQPDQRDDRSRGADRGQQQGWSHPLAKPAPPVQERTPQKQQQEEQKYHDWQQREPAPATRQQQPPPLPNRQAPPPNRNNPPQGSDDKPHRW